MVRKNFILVVLIVGTVLVGFGLFGKLAVGGEPKGPVGEPGDNLALENYISYASATKPCDDYCPVEIVGEPTTLGRYVGGYLISFRTCPQYQCGNVDDKDYCWCSPDEPSSPESSYKGNFSSGFGILILRSAPNMKKPAILMPLEPKDVPNLPPFMSDYDEGMLWMQYNLTNYVDPSPTTGGNFEYEPAGLLGGCVDQNDECGRVFLEHTISVVNRDYNPGDPLSE
ncbi:hypothetical protein ACFL0Z_01770 [Patescibacteria group bacterium]